MKYYIKGEGKNSGKYAEANFEIRRWNGSGWDPDVAHDLEVNVPWGTVMTWAEYDYIIDWWTNEAESEGYDMTDHEVFSDSFDELDFYLDEIPED